MTQTTKCYAGYECGGPEFCCGRPATPLSDLALALWAELDTDGSTPPGMLVAGQTVDVILRWFEDHGDEIRKALKSK